MSNLDKNISKFDKIFSFTVKSGMMVSLPFLLATFLVYAFIPELRNLHGLAMMSYLSALFVMYLSLVFIKLKSKALMELELCQVIGYITYYSVLVVFFFLNVISIDIYNTFK